MSDTPDPLNPSHPDPLVPATPPVPPPPAPIAPQPQVTAQPRAAQPDADAAQPHSACSMTTSDTGPRPVSAER